MSDPAIEAAQRAMDSMIETCGNPGDLGPVLHDLSRLAAREAHKLIRELHKPSGKLLFQHNQYDHVCAGCCDPWPCATADLIYTTEELASDV